MLTLSVALAARALSRQFAVAIGLAAVLGATGLLEGRLPRVETVTALVPLAGFLGAGWAIAGWRAEGADVAAACLGGRLALPLVMCALIASPAVAAATAFDALGRPGVNAAGPRLELVEGALIGAVGSARVTVRWKGDVAYRSDSDQPWAGFPAPSAHPVAPAWVPAVYGRLAVQIGTLFLLIIGLALRSSPPTLPVTLGAAVTAFGVSQALAVFA